MKYSILPILMLFIISYACDSNSSQKQPSAPAEGWAMAQEIEESVTGPVFPDKDFPITEYGASEGENTKNTKAFADAIQACHDAGGGRVVVAQGIFYTGPIHLLDNVNLHLEEGAEIRFSTNPQDYLPLVHTSFEGTELMNYSPLVYAYGKKNIAVTGKGVLNGQASKENWWIWKGSPDYGWQVGVPNQNDSLSRPRLVEMAEQNVAVEERVFGEGFNLRPSFVEFFECENILIQGVKIINSPFWVIHPIKSENILVDGVTVDSHGPNNDGCDPEYCKNVVIKNCTFNTGDDCIAIKSGRNADGRRVNIQSERILVKDCKMIDGHGGVVMGSEISAGVRDVFVENCVMSSPNLDRAIRIKTNSKRGGFVENLYVRNLEVGQVKEAFLKVNMFYATYSDQTGGYIPQVKNITIENVKVENGGHYAILAKGYKEKPIQNITLKNVVIEKVEEAFSVENVEGLELIETYINGSMMQNPAEEE